MILLNNKICYLYSLNYLCCENTSVIGLLKAMFFDPSLDTRRVWVNDTVARYDGPFCHCELQFSDGKACTIYMKQKAVLKQRSGTFGPCYTCVSIPLKKEAELAARKHAEAIVERGESFSMLGMLTALTPIHAPSWVGTFCSRLCCEVLQEAGVIPWSIDARGVSPSKLHSLLTASKDLGAHLYAAPSHRPASVDVESVAIDFK